MHLENDMSNALQMNFERARHRVGQLTLENRKLQGRIKELQAALDAKAAEGKPKKVKKTKGAK